MVLAPLAPEPLTLLVREPYPNQPHHLVLIRAGADADGHRTVAEPQVIDTAVKIPRAVFRVHTAEGNGDHSADVEEPEFFVAGRRLVVVLQAQPDRDGYRERH